MRQLLHQIEQKVRNLTAAGVRNTPAGNLSATTVQAAVNELDTEKLALSGGTMTGALTLDYSSDYAQLASNGVLFKAAAGDTQSIGGLVNLSEVLALVLGAGGSSAVDWTLSRSAANVATLGTGDFLRAPTAPSNGDDLTNKTYVDGQVSAHTGDSADAHAASAITNTAAGNIVATTVQAAINELDTEKLALSGGTMTGSVVINAGSNSAVHSADGLSVLAAAGDAQPLAGILNISDTALLVFGAGGSTAVDIRIQRTAAGILRISDLAGTGGAALEFLEQTAPSAPAANGCRLYVQDNGAGKTQLMALFSSGAAQEVAIQP